MQLVNMNGNQPNFGQVNIVRVSKKAFQNPKDYKECNRVFSIEVSSAIGDLQGRLAALLALFGIGGKNIHKAYTILESPGYAYIEGVMKKQTIPSRHWLSLHTDFPVNIPADDGYHKFFVLTGEDKDNALKIVNTNYLFKIFKSVSNASKGHKEKVNRDPRAKDRLYIHTGVAYELDTDFNKIIENGELHEFKIDDLGEIANISSQFGVK